MSSDRLLMPHAEKHARSLLLVDAALALRADDAAATPFVRKPCSVGPVQPGDQRSTRTSVPESPSNRSIMVADWRGPRNRASILRSASNDCEGGSKRDLGGAGVSGWTYLVVESPKLALRDFELAIELDPKNADAYNGRSYAPAKLGRHGGPYRMSPKLSGSDRRRRDCVQRGAGIAQCPNRYPRRAVDLIRRALSSLPAAERPRLLDHAY